MTHAVPRETCEQCGERYVSVDGTLHHVTEDGRKLASDHVPVPDPDTDPKPPRTFHKKVTMHVAGKPVDIYANTEAG